METWRKAEVSIPKPLRVPTVFRTAPRAVVVYLPCTSKFGGGRTNRTPCPLWEHPIISSDGPELSEITLRRRVQGSNLCGFYTTRFPGESVYQFRQLSDKNAADHYIGALSPCVASIVNLLAELEPLTMATKIGLSRGVAPSITFMRFTFTQTTRRYLTADESMSLGLSAAAGK